MARSSFLSLPRFNKTASIVFCGLLLALIVSPVARAADAIEFPEDELATESVLPVFDHAESVKNRAGRMTNRFEVGASGSLSLMEPFYSPYSVGGTATYHWSEVSGFNVFGTYFLQGLSENGNNLNPIPGTSPSRNANLQYAPQPKYALLGNYEYTPFYGKISITKDFVMNLGVYGFIGIGAMGVGDTVCPAGDIGFGQKLYFTQNFAIRLDLRFMMYNGPDVLSRNLQSVSSEQSASSFDSKLIFTGQLSAGLIFLL